MTFFNLERSAKECRDYVDAYNRDVVELVIELETFLTSTSPSVRAKGVNYLTLFLSKKNPLNVEQIHFLCDFFSNRLSDNIEVIPSTLNGVLSLVELPHIDPADLLMLLRKIFKELFVQSLNQQCRLSIFFIFHAVLHKHYVSVFSNNPDNGREFVSNFIQAIDGESDPRNLPMVFKCTHFVCNHLPIESYINELFEVVSSYFPITVLDGTESMEVITIKELRLSLNPLFSATPLFCSLSIPFLLDKLSSSIISSQMEALCVLQDCFPVYKSSSSFDSHLLPIWKALRKLCIFYQTVDIQETTGNCLQVFLSCCTSNVSFIDNLTLDVVNTVFSESAQSTFFIFLKFISSSADNHNRILNIFMPKFTSWFNSENTEELRTKLSFFLDVVRISLSFSVNSVYVEHKSSLLALITNFYNNEALTVEIVTLLTLLLKLFLVEYSITDFLPLLSISRFRLVSEDLVIPFSEFINALLISNSSSYSHILDYLLESKIVIDDVYLLVLHFHAYTQLATINTRDNSERIVRLILTICKEKCHHQLIKKLFVLNQEAISQDTNLLYSFLSVSDEEYSEVRFVCVEYFEICQLLVNNIDILNCEVQFQTCRSLLDPLQFESLDQTSRFQLLLYTFCSFPSNYVKCFTNDVIAGLIMSQAESESSSIVIAKSLALLLNKSPNDDSLLSNLKSILSIIKSGLNDSDISTRKIAFNKLKYIVKAVILKGSSLTLDYINVLLDCYFAKIFESDIIELFSQLLSNDECIWTKSFNFKCTLFYKQKFYVAVAPRLRSLCEEFHRSQKISLIVPLVNILMNLPFNVFERDLNIYLPITLKAADDDNNQLPSEVIQLLSKFSKISDDLMKECISDFVKIMVKRLSITNQKQSLNVRLECLKCLGDLTAFKDQYKILPLKKEVLKTLSSYLDDHKRIVRKAAVVASAKWTLLSAPT